MNESDTGSVARLLAEMRGGNQAALNELLPLVYAELRDLAHQNRRRWHGDNTLGTTALVHEAYLKLAASDGAIAESRVHFLRVASKAMRQILCNYARDSRASKRGGDAPKLSLDAMGDAAEEITFTADQSDAVLELDDALTRLHQVDERLGAVVECRFFGALSVDETASALAISPATVKRDWSLARAWLFRELSTQG